MIMFYFYHIPVNLISRYVVTWSYIPTLFYVNSNSYAEGTHTPQYTISMITFNGRITEPCLSYVMRLLFNR